MAIFKSRSSATLRTHLIVLVVLVMLPALLFGGYTLRQIGESYRNASEAHLRDAASGLAMAFDQVIELHFSTLRTVAKSPLLDEGATDTAALYDYVDSVSRSLGTYIVVTDGDLQQLVNTSKPHGTPLPRNSPDGPASRTLASGQPHVSDVYIGRVSGRGVVSFFFPVIRDGKVIKVIDMPLDPRRLARMLEGLGLSQSTAAVLTDKAHSIVAQSQDHDRFATFAAPQWYAEELARSPRGLAAGPAMDGTDRVFAFQRLSSTPWTVGVSEPLASFEGSWRDPFISLTVGGIALMLLASALAAHYGNRLVRPVNRLADRAEAVPAGGSFKSPEASSSVVEFERLEHALAAAATVLQTRAESERQAAAAAQRAQSDAERANLCKSKFLAAASHDLRQPVQALVLLLGALRYRADDKLQTLINPMERTLDGLRMLLDGLLDVSRLDAGILTPNPELVAICPTLRRLAVEYRARAKDKGLELRLRPCDVDVTTDPMLLDRILRNFLDNAIRFTDSGGILLSCRQRGDMVRIEVWDSGIGIDPTQQSQIFEEFHQVGNPSRDRTLGLGLGLAIVRRAAALIGGEIDLVSRPGQGSRFALMLPAGPANFKKSRASLFRGVEDGRSQHQVSQKSMSTEGAHSRRPMSC